MSELPSTQPEENPRPKEMLIPTETARGFGAALDTLIGEPVMAINQTLQELADDPHTEGHDFAPSLQEMFTKVPEMITKLREGNNVRIVPYGGQTRFQFAEAMSETKQPEAVSSLPVGEIAVEKTLADALVLTSQERLNSALTIVGLAEAGMVGEIHGAAIVQATNKITEQFKKVIQTPEIKIITDETGVTRFDIPSKPTA